MTGLGVTFVYTLFPGADEAKAAARTVVGERLAACANILTPCISIYQWQGVMEEGEEVPVLFKTTPGGRAALMGRLAALHVYDVPAILSWDATAVHDPYVQWVAGQVGEVQKG